MLKQFLDKIRSSKNDIRNCTVGVVGLGYVGLPLALRFLDENFPVICFDIDSKKIESLKAGKSYIKHIPDDRIFSMATHGETVFTNTPNSLRLADAIILCVPTPLTRNKEPDLAPILNSMNMILPYLREGQLIVLESTTYPGTTDEILRPMLEKVGAFSPGFEVGRNFFLAFSPEREDPGNNFFNTQNTPKIVGGCTPSCLNAATELYEAIVDTVVPVRNTKIAEMAKILENTYRFVNISFINEMKLICEKMDMDIYEVIKAAASKPFGFTPYYPCGGVGGHCLPLDPFYLRFKAREFNVPTRFIELAGEVNSYMPEYVVDRITEALNEKSKAVKGSEILLLGVAYKKNIDDYRESAAIEIWNLLLKKGASVSYSDPHIPEFLGKPSFPLSKTLKHFDCVVIITDHDDFDYELIEKNSPLIVDTRGRFAPNGSNIFRA